MEEKEKEEEKCQENEESQGYENTQEGESESLHLVLEPDTENLLNDSQDKKEEEEETVIESRYE